MGDDLDAIEKRHPPGTYRDVCPGCGQLWPCDVRALVRRVRELEATLQRERDWLHEVDGEA